MSQSDETKAGDPATGGPPNDMPSSDGPTVDIRHVSIKCGHCSSYQTLSHFARREQWHVYTYECENDTCDPAVTRTLVEVPIAIDTFARRDPDWHGGKRHAGGDAEAAKAAEAPVMQTFEYDPFAEET